MDLATWRAARTQRLELPSGLVVTVRKVGLLDLAAQGRIPMPLADAAAALLQGEARPFDPATFPDTAALISLVVRAAVVDPPVADAPDDTHLGVDELPMLDRIEIFNWAQQEGRALLPFPASAGGSADVARGGDDVPHTSVGDPGD